MPKLTLISPSGEVSPSGEDSPKQGPRTPAQKGKILHVHKESWKTPQLSSEGGVQIDGYSTERETLDVPSPNPCSTQLDVERVSFGLIHPNEIQYKVLFVFLDQKISPLSGFFNPEAPNSYEEIVQEASRHVKETCKEKLVAKSLYLRHRYCTTRANAVFRARRSIRDKSEWISTCELLVNTLKKNDRCCLDIHLEYFALQCKSIANLSLMQVRKWELNKLMKTNISGDQYIPAADLERFVEPAMIEATLEDSGLGLGADEISDFIKIINSKARKLFAACLLAKVSLKCLKQWTDAGINDDNWPASVGKPKRCCPNHTEYPEDKEIDEYRNRFLVASFEKDDPPQQFGRGIVVPIIPIDAERSESVREEFMRSSDGSIVSPTTSDISPALSRGEKTPENRALIGEGAHGRVYCVRIDACHHSLSTVSLVLQ